MLYLLKDFFENKTELCGTFPYIIGVVVECSHRVHLGNNLGQLVHNTSAGNPLEAFTDRHGGVCVFIAFNSYKNVANTH